MRKALFASILILGASLAPLVVATAEDAQATEFTPPAVVQELIKLDTVEGDGPQAVAAREVVVHYTGWLYDPEAEAFRGQKFDSSVDRGRPLPFRLGAGRVIRGWDEGVAGMKVGGERTLIIPPSMAYGSRGAGRVIPPNATLVFDVQLLEVR